MPAATQAQSSASPKVTPLERDILLAAWQAPNRTLRRAGSGFVAMPAFARSGPTRAQGFTKRLAIRLCDQGLLQFDDAHCPSSLQLTPAGVALVEQLQAAANESHRHG